MSEGFSNRNGNAIARPAAHEALSDEELMHEVQSGDGDAFTVLFDRYHLSPETLKTYKLGSTPQTIVISSEGKVLQDWARAYVGEQQKQIEVYFHVSLPGLRAAAKN